MAPFFPALSELHQWITESVPAAFISHVSDAFFTALAAGWCNQILESVINGGAEGACWWTSKLQSHIALIICFPLLKRGVALHTPNPQPTGEAPRAPRPFLPPLISLYFTSAIHSTTPPHLFVAVPQLSVFISCLCDLQKARVKTTFFFFSLSLSSYFQPAAAQ